MYKTLSYLKDDKHLQEAISLRTAVHVREVMGGDFVAFISKENTDQPARADMKQGWCARYPCVI